MNSNANDTPDLKALWQSDGSSKDVAAIAESLMRGRAQGWRIYYGFMAVYILATILTVVAEVAGAYKTKGYLSTALVAYFAFWIWTTKRARRKMPLIASLDPQGQLKHALERAKEQSAHGPRFVCGPAR